MISTKVNKMKNKVFHLLSAASQQLFKLIPNNIKMNIEKVKDLREKIMKGLDLTYERLIASKLKDNSDLAISRNGKVVRVKAKDIINKK